MEETRVPGENHRPAANHWQTLSDNDLSSTPSLSEILELTTLEVIDTDCIGSYKSNYHTVLTTTASTIIIIIKLFEAYLNKKKQMALISKVETVIHIIDQAM